MQTLQRELLSLQKGTCTQSGAGESSAIMQADEQKIRAEKPGSVCSPESLRETSLAEECSAAVTTATGRENESSKHSGTESHREESDMFTSSLPNTIPDQCHDAASQLQDKSSYSLVQPFASNQRQQLASPKSNTVAQQVKASRPFVFVCTGLSSEETTMVSKFARSALCSAAQSADPSSGGSSSSSAMASSSTSIASKKASVSFLYYQ